MCMSDKTGWDTIHTGYRYPHSENFPLSHGEKYQMKTAQYFSLKKYFRIILIFPKNLKPVIGLWILSKNKSEEIVVS